MKSQHQYCFNIAFMPEAISHIVIPESYLKDQALRSACKASQRDSDQSPEKEPSGIGWLPAAEGGLQPGQALRRGTSMAPVHPAHNTGQPR